jgi:hypothetical protein
VSQPAAAASRNQACEQLYNKAAMYSVIGDLYYLSGDYINSAIYDSMSIAYTEAWIAVC